MTDCPTAGEYDARDTALRALLHALGEREYAFVTPTPASHARIVARPTMREGRGLADVFGWNLPFARSLLAPDLLAILEAGDLLEPVEGGLLRSKVRVSSLRGALYAHSSYPTVDEDAVFFGPDSYRFANLIAAELPGLGLPDHFTAADVGTGAGVGAMVIKQLCPNARAIGTDVNPQALRFAAANAEVAGAAIELIEAEAARPLGMPLDIVVANPPYIIDPKSRTYRDGGDLHGAKVSIDMVAEMLPQLSDRGWLILYTGSAIVGGEDRLQRELGKLAAGAGRTCRYSSLDPDVFGEELARDIYCEVDRIELVAAVLGPPAG
jgi:methylase of polypeptide subunit release factors